MAPDRARAPAARPQRAARDDGGGASSHRGTVPSFGVPSPIPVYLAEAIRDAIVRWEYPPGARLKEQELEARFQTSRGPVREALRLLELGGLVEHEPRRGFRARRCDAQEIADIYELRADLEAMVIDRLRDRDLGPLLDVLEQSNQRFKVLRDSGAVEPYLAENVLFHRQLHEAAGNKPLSRAIENLTEIAQPIRFASLSLDIRQSKAVEHHEEIVRRLRAGDLEGGREFVRRHILSNLAHVRTAYATKLRSLSAD